MPIATGPLHQGSRGKFALVDLLRMRALLDREYASLKIYRPTSSTKYPAFENVRVVP
jgi:hypothetical protein